MKAPETDAAGTTCLSEDEVVAFAAGGLAPEALARAEQHLDRCPECRGIVSAFVAATNSRNTNDRSASARLMSTLAPGECVVERYEILRLVARGGMGEVYEARRSAAGRGGGAQDHACSPRSTTSARWPRLKAEVRLARKVTHRNVCRILEFGVHASPSAGRPRGVPFLTMELLAGETLRQAPGPGGPHDHRRRRCPSSCQMIEGLAAIHAAGIVHRDLKPENVFLARRGPGIARRW